METWSDHVGHDENVVVNDCNELNTMVYHENMV